MENLISSADLCEELNNGKVINVSYSNRHSFTQFSKVHHFLSVHHSEENWIKQKILFKKETFRQNYYTAINEIFANIETKNSH
jgi:hypothetical protein